MATAGEVKVESRVRGMAGLVIEEVSCNEDLETNIVKKN